MSSTGKGPAASPSIFEKVSSKLQEAEEGVIHTAQGMAEGLKHGTSQLLHGGREEIKGFQEGVRESNESIPRHVPGTGVGSGDTRLAGKEVGQTSGSLLDKGQEVMDTMKQKAQAMVDRGKELTGAVSREAGHAAGAAKSMDPDQEATQPSPRVVKTTSTAFPDVIQQEYQAGEQEELANPPSSSMKDEPINATEAAGKQATKVKEAGKGIVGGVARKYGEASESVRMKAEEGAKEAHK